MGGARVEKGSSFSRGCDIKLNQQLVILLDVVSFWSFRADVDFIPIEVTEEVPLGRVWFPIVLGLAVEDRNWRGRSAILFKVF